MELQVSGKLKTATAQQPSFRGFRIEAFFHRKCVPAASSDRIAAPSATSTSADATIPDQVSALSDDAGNFTLVLPAQQEIATQTVNFTVSSPAGRIVRQMEVTTANFEKEITIEVDAGSFDKVEPKLYTPQSVAVDALFRTDAALRRAITENLKPLRGQSEAVVARVEKAWNFRPSRLSAEELARRHYAAPGSDSSEVLHTVIMGGVDALRSAKTERALVLRNSAELKRLIRNQESGDSLHGVVELGPLIEFIQRRGAGPIQGAELTSTPYAAEAEAEAILGAIGHKDGAPVARQQALTSNALEAEELVKKTVNKQMESATGPEAELAYGKIPNSADEDQAQKAILQSFEPRKGPTDVTSYHDFHTLQIAFEHVWTEIFDGQLASLGRDIYGEYVRLKDYSGSIAPDFQVGTLADLRRLIDEVKKLSQFVDEETPAVLRPAGSDQKTSGLPTPTPEDVVRIGGEVATGGAMLFIEWAFNELIKLGNKPVVVTWNDLPLKLNEGRGNIIELRPPETNALPQGSVEIILETDTNSYKKRISFQQWDRQTQRTVYNADLQNFGGGHGPVDRLVLNFVQVQDATLKFVSEDEIVNELLLGRYVLGDLTAKLQDRTRLTFRWKGQR
jgi:hypothetical protein